MKTGIVVEPEMLESTVLAEPKKIQAQRTGANWLFYFFAVGIPLLLVLLWHGLNTVHPNDDCGDYFETTMRMWNAFQDSGFGGALHAAYFNRDFRPVLFPVLAAPFVILNQGEILPSVAMSMAFFYFVFLTYAYKLSREVLSPFRAALATLFLGSISWVVHFTYFFMSEMSLMACTLPVLYHFKKSDFFTSKKHAVAVGIWLFLCFAIRPVETILSFSLPVFIAIVMSFRKGRIQTRDLVIATPLFLWTCGLLLDKALFTHKASQLAVLWFLGVGVHIWFLFKHKRFGLNLPFQLAFFMTTFLSSGWWLPEARRLYEWLQIPTGINAVYYHDRGKMEFFQAVGAFFANVGGYPLLVAFGLSLLGMIVFLRANSKSLKQFFLYQLIGLTMILPPILMLSLTPDIAYRRAFQGFAFLLLANATFALHPDFLLKRLRTFLLGLWICSQLFVMTAYTFNIFPQSRAFLAPYFKSTPYPLKGGDPSARTFEHLRSLPLGNARIATFSLAMNQFIERPFDVSGLKVMLTKYRSKLHFSYPPPYPDLQESYRYVIENYDYVMVDVSTEPPDKQLDPYERITLDLMRRWQNGILSEMGLRYITEFQTLPAILPRHERQEKTILLLQVQRPGEPRFSFKENIALAAKDAAAGSNATAKNSVSSNLNDGHELYDPWISLPGREDTYFYITRPEGFRAKLFNLILFTDQGLLRDLSVIATSDSVHEQPRWKVIKSRVGRAGIYSEKITVPHAKDGSVVRIELDTTDPNWGAYKTFGLRCFSASRSYQRNYANPEAGEMAAREFQISEDLELPSYSSSTPKIFMDHFVLASGDWLGATARSETGFPLSHLQDDNTDTAWGSISTRKDTVFYLTRPAPYKAEKVKIVLFTGPNGGHIRDVSVVATNDEIDGSESWQVIPGRLDFSSAFADKITIPELPDKTVVTLELDQNKMNPAGFKTFGLASFSLSRGDRRNYVAGGGGIYVREFEVLRK